MRVRTAIRKMGAVALAVAGALAVPRPARAGRLGPDIIALFPKEVGEFAYADLKKARSQKWFPQLQEQMLPERFRQFEKFLASAGVDPNSQVDELAWGLVAQGLNAKTEGVGSSVVPTGEEVVGVALRRKPISNSRSCQRSKRGATRCTRLGPVRGQTICFSSSSIPIRPRSAIARSWKRW